MDRLGHATAYPEGTAHPEGTVRSRPTKAALVPVAVATLLVGLATLTGDGWLLLLATAALGLDVAALLLRPRLDGLTYCFDAPARVTAGAPARHGFHVHNRGRRTSPALRLTHRVAGFDDVVLAVRPVRPGGTATVELSRTARRRTRTGSYQFVVISSAPLGMLAVTQVIDGRRDLVVHPHPIGVPAPDPRAAGTADGPARPAPGGIDPGGVRDWRPGDGARRVHWRTTARLGRPIVLDREQQVAPGLAIVVAGPAAAPDWERLVSAVASAATGAVREGRPVALGAAQPGLAGLCEGTGPTLLDWCAALGDPGPPGPDVLGRAVAWAGRGGRVLLAAPADWRAEWWTPAARIARAAGGELELFRPSGGPGT
jgi:uncharacterized protein (DUF58 family)